MMHVKLTAEQRLQKAVIDIMAHPRYMALSGVMLVGKVTVRDDIPTACTNGRDEFYGRAFVDSLSDKELRFLKLHEVYHKMYKHLTGLQHLFKLDAGTANQACDYVINTQLVEENKGDKFATMTGPLTIGCYDLKYKGWDSVSVFRDLRKNAEESGGGKGSSGGEGFDQHDWEDAEALDPEERRQLEREIDEAVRQGVLAASKLGTGGSRDFGDLLQPQQDWREVLREFVQTTCTGHDYSTWRRPNRRYVASGMYMPSGISETIGEIVIAPDMSGSIGAREINRMLSETKAIAQIVKPEAVRLLYWDTKICADERYVQAELDSLVDSTKPAGGGGTMVECVPEHITAEQIKAQCAVVFTDGYLGGTWGEWPCPVLWVIVDNKNCHPPFGTVLHVTARDF
jgi:predicted metal-dependent peptidase